MLHKLRGERAIWDITDEQADQIARLLFGRGGATRIADLGSISTNFGVLFEHILRLVIVENILVHSHISLLFRDKMIRATEGEGLFNTVYKAIHVLP